MNIDEETLLKYAANPKLFNKLKPVTEAKLGMKVIGFKNRGDAGIYSSMIGTIRGVNRSLNEATVEGFIKYTSSGCSTINSWLCNKNSSGGYGSDCENGTLYELKSLIPELFKEVKND
jgi:hypothetical protein